jgi:hypothetical protein
VAKSWLCGLLPVVAIACWGFGAGCGDDSSGNPDGTTDASDGGPDESPDVTLDDGSRPDEPIGPGDYPPAPYGVAVGDRIENLLFQDIDDHPLDLADIYADTSVKLLWIYATAGWCSVCTIESAALPAIWNTFHPQGLQILGVVFEDGAGNPAGVSYAHNYATRDAWPFLAAADQPFVLGRYFDKAATPMNMLVDLTDMRIISIDMGWAESSMRSAVTLNLSRIADRTP